MNAREAAVNVPVDLHVLYATRGRFAVSRRQVDHRVAREGRVQRDLHQPAGGALVKDGRQPVQRNVGQRSIGAQRSQAAGPLGTQRSSIGQELRRPRTVQPRCKRLHLLAGRVNVRRLPARARGHRDEDRRRHQYQCGWGEEMSPPMRVRLLGDALGSQGGVQKAAGNVGERHQGMPHGPRVAAIGEHGNHRSHHPECHA